MKYFKEISTGEVYAYDAYQLLQSANISNETPQVFKDIAEKLKGMSELTGATLDAHLNPKLASRPPTTCTPAQGLVALHALKGITDADISAAIGAIPDAVQRYTAQIGFSRATSWERNSATMQMMANLLGLSQADLDALFVFAIGVEV